jgi:hypothetical protein
VTCPVQDVTGPALNGGTENSIGVPSAASHISRRHYQMHKQEYMERAKRRKLVLKRWVNWIKRVLGCARCPERHPACLDFHHPDPTVKEATINQLVNCGNADRIRREIAKCILLCANCHRKEHHARS